MNSDRTYVYFIATADRSMVKIGCSEDPDRRLSGLAAWSPVPLTILAQAPGTLWDERAIHNALIEHYSHKEWFRGSPEVLALAREVEAQRAVPERLRGKRGIKSLIAVTQGVRTSPEWRTRMSVAHKKRWAVEHARRLLIQEASNFVFAHQGTYADFNRMAGGDFIRVRNDGSIFVFNDDIEQLQAGAARIRPDLHPTDSAEPPRPAAEAAE